MRLFSHPSLRFLRLCGESRAVVWAMLLLGFAAPNWAAEAVRFYPALTLNDGRQLTAVEVVTYSMTDVLIRHSGGATTLQSRELPEQVRVDLHMPAPAVPVLLATDPAFLAMADKVAAPPVATALARLPPVSASQPAVMPAASGPGPAALVAPAITALAESPSKPTPAPIAAAVPVPMTKTASVPTIVDAGEGNLPADFFSKGKTNIGAAETKWTTFAGRVLIRLADGGMHFFGNMVVRAYPQDRLALYLNQARAKSAELAQQLREQAAAALREGRAADSLALSARAAETVHQYLDFLPEAPAEVRTDEYGNFTVRHQLPDMRLVAVGRVNVPGGEATYAWVGVTPGEDALLTETNATTVAINTVGETHFVRK